MRLSKFTDYSFRVLILAASASSKLTIEDAITQCGVPRGHVKKVVRTLAGAGYLKSSRGRGGGFELARRPSDIRLSDVLNLTETDFALVECFHPGGSCPLVRNCGLIGVVSEARSGFLAPFASRTLADIC